jgi:hypothetical protein
VNEPPLLAARPHHGRFPIPFITLVRDGKPDFRVQDNRRRERCAFEYLCQLCGESLGKPFVFCGWAQSVERRTFGEPPMHADCCDWAWATCPFLLGGDHRPLNIDDVISLGMWKSKAAPAPRHMAVYTTTDFEPVPCGEGSGSIKYVVAPPTSIEWRDRFQTGNRAQS